MERAGLPSIPREIRGNVYNVIREQFSQPKSKGSKETWTDAFVKSLFKEALHNPNGDIGRMLAKNLMQDDILSNLDAQTEKLLSRDTDFLEYRVMKQCFKQQRDVLFDIYEPRKILMTSRRAGKTSCAARLLVFSCIRPNTPTLYIHIKFDNAIRQCYEDCIEVAKAAELNIKRSSKAEGLIEFSNGSTISFRGNSDKAAADRFRGGKYRTIIIDEAAFQCNMKYLVEDVSLPMLADYEKHQIVMVSTPPRVPHTYFEDCINSGDWKLYHWTAKDNPYIPNFGEFIREICDKKKLDLDSPFIRREFYGELVYDTEAQVYKHYSTYEAIPASFVPTDCAIGVDFGFSDYNSMVALTYNRNTGEGYVTEVRKFNKANVSTIVDAAKQTYDAALKLCLKHNNAFDLCKIWLYCDTSDQSISYEMSTKYKLPVSNCLKYDKALGMEQLADLLRTEKIKLQAADNILADEISRTVYKRDDTDAILPEIDDAVFHPDALDALLYASRQYVHDCNIPADIVTTITIDEARAKTLPSFIADAEVEVYDDDNEQYA